MSEIEYLINSCYGVFQFSQRAIDMYNEKTGAAASTFDELRDDVTMIEIVKTIGAVEASGSSSYLQIIKIPIEYKEYVRVHEYDGMEEIEINVCEYKLDKISNVIADGLNPDLTIRTIAEILDESEIKLNYGV